MPIPSLPNNDARALSERRKLYVEAFARARQILDVPNVQWIQPAAIDPQLPLVLAECEAMLYGCTRLEADEALTHTVAMMRCTRPSPLVWAGYLNIMMMFPRELLLPSIALAIANEKYHVLPAVGALVAAAKAELELKRAKLGDLKRAIGRLQLRQLYTVKEGERSREARVRGSSPRPPGSSGS